MFLAVLLLLISAVLPLFLHFIFSFLTALAQTSYDLSGMFWFYASVFLCGGILYLFQLFASRMQRLPSALLKLVLVFLYAFYFFHFSQAWDSAMIQCYLLAASGFCLFSAAGDLAALAVEKKRKNKSVLA